MKINKYIGMAVCSWLMVACQSDEMEINQPQESGRNTLIGQIMNSDAQGRAQIALGGKEVGIEYFFWNEEDRFTLFQNINGELQAGEFVISEDYKEANGGEQFAEFSGTTALTSKAGYTAVYPSPSTVTDNEVRLEIQREVDFTTAITDAQKAEVWKNYFRNNMFMTASGTFSESGRNYIQFWHLCSLARITYINQTGSEQQINGVDLKGQNLGFYMNYDLVNNRESGSGSFLDFRFTTKGLKVADKDTVDIYIFFFPKAVEKTDLEISIKQTAGNKTLTLPWNDILVANGNNESFRAGYRYWFNVTDTEKGLNWTKNMAEGGWIVFENKELSNALYEVLGNYKVLMTDEGYAKITEEQVNSTYQLDFSNITCELSSLDGLEKFKNLNTLKCNGLNLEMDLLDLSAFSNLQHVEVWGNKLKALKFSANSWMMTYLDCHDNMISELDITGMTNIDFKGTLICGSQKDNVILNLKMNDSQKNKWETEWVNHEFNENVSYEGMSTEAKMKLVAKNGGTFTVSERIRLTSPLIVEGDLTLEFSDGAFDGDIGQFVDVDGLKAMVVIKPGASLTINGNSEFNTGHMLTQLSCIRMIGGSDAPSKFVMNNGNLIGTYHAILVDEDCKNAEIEINGGSLSCDWQNEFNGVVIFNQSDAKITINGGSFRSPLKDGVSVSSIETWGGELNISGGRFETGIETLQEGVSVNPSVGNTLVGPAISIAPKKDIAVNITGGTFYGKGAYAIYEKTVASGVNPTVSLSITGGTFDNAIWSVDCTGFINGGQYKLQPEADFVVDGKAAIKDGDYYIIGNAESNGGAELPSWGKEELGNN